VLDLSGASFEENTLLIDALEEAAPVPFHWHPFPAEQDLGSSGEQKRRRELDDDESDDDCEPRVDATSKRTSLYTKLKRRKQSDVEANSKLEISLSSNPVLEAVNGSGWAYSSRIWKNRLQFTGWMPARSLVSISRAC
jgi:hypothetical protein